MPIHPTAIVDRRAEVDPTAEIGPYAIVEPDVTIGPRVRLWPHAFVARGTTLEAGVQVHPFAVVGHHPQDLAWDASPSYTRIGEGTIVREHATIHRGTGPESWTIVGRRCYIMSTGHVGHNCVLGDEVKVANSGLLSGHVRVGDGAFISGNVSVHQFVRIGRLAMVGGGMRLNADLPPFMLFAPGGVIGPNTVGLRRAGLSAEARREIREAYHTLYRRGLRLAEAIERIAARVQTPEARELIEFLRAERKRPIATFRPMQADHGGQSPPTGEKVDGGQSPSTGSPQDGGQPPPAGKPETHHP